MGGGARRGGGCDCGVVVVVVEMVYTGTVESRIIEQCAMSSRIPYLGKG